MQRASADLDHLAQALAHWLEAAHSVDPALSALALAEAQRKLAQYALVTTESMRTTSARGYTPRPTAA
jgi:hypothetical protein